MADGASEGLSSPAAAPAADAVSVGVGRRVLVVANLRLTAQSTAASTWAAGVLAKALDTWAGPGVLVVAGDLFDFHGSGDPAAALSGALSAHDRMAQSLRAFASGDEREVICIPGGHDAAIGDEAAARRLTDAGARVAAAVDLHLETTSGTRLVRIEAGGVPASDPGAAAPATVVSPDPSAPWQSGLDRLVDTDAAHRFLTSRLLYRRFARLAWWLLVPFAVAVALRFRLSADLLYHLVRSHPAPAHAVTRARLAGWGPRLAVAAAIAAAEVLVLVAVLGWLSRQAWRSLGGGRLPHPFDDDGGPTPGATVNDAGRDAARALAEHGYAGYVSGTSAQAELSHLAGAFFASPGVVGEVVEEHPGRLGLPPVFLEHAQASWVELETGAELHTRLLLARNDQGAATVLERLVARYRRAHDAFPVVVAAHPHGSSWPPAPDLSAVRRRSRRVRRWTALAIALAGVTDLLSALTPPLRGRLHLVLQILPLAATQAAGAVVALSGIGLLALARGVRRGQHRAWAIAAALLGLTLVLHVVRGGDLEESALSAVVLVLLVVYRDEFRAPSDRPSARSAVVTLVAGAVGATVVTTFVVELVLRLGRHPHHFIALWRAAYAVLERLVGYQSVVLTDRLDDFLTPTLLAIGIVIALCAVLLATRPVVDRRLITGRAAELRARDIVHRHGRGTLDYFSLRSDKRWFFHRDSLVAYAVSGGVCLVSPDPIGPVTEREQVWAAFRRYTDERGLVLSVMGASEDWLPVYRATGMHDIYIGDEAVVDLQRFSLQGGHMKGLRQAHNRIAKYGYRATFHDPSRLDAATATSLIPLMSQSRRGEFERGFSMMLGRVFDPRDHGLVLCVVTGADGAPAAMCQFVPAIGIDGYSLDLMRRDRGEHPNGLIDFALVSSIEHFRDQGCQGLSLNFAAMRSILEGERGDGLTQRVERWALQKMSGFLQIETLWKFNAKYGPDWLPRYIVYDSAEHLVPAVLAIMRAESLAEIPVIGRVLVRSQRKAARAGEDGLDHSAASLLPSAGNGATPGDEPPEHPAPAASGGAPEAR
ncbi:MAG: phosphatidylglycerol lysyltransferase domain-containing protein [Acidimicrobiales bacterium]